MFKAFFDASVIFSALYSKSGASYALALFIKHGKLIGITTETVIEEVVRNVHKFKKIATLNVHQFIIEHRFVVRKSIAQNEIQPIIHMVQDKDAHVIAGSLLTSCKFLVTFDKKHLNNQKTKQNFPSLTILSPQKLLQLLVE